MKEKEEKIVFIAHPIKGDVLGNSSKVLEICKKIHSDKIIPFAPYLVLLSYLNDDDPMERELGIAASLKAFYRGYIDELWLYGDCISAGMKKEILLALDLGIPIIPKTPETKIGLAEIVETLNTANEESASDDRLAEATNGKLHWNDPGMTDLEEGWEDFPIGTFVEVRTDDNIWRAGMVVETWEENDRGIEVRCNDKWHDNLEFYGGHGASVMVYMNTRRGILSNIRKL